MRVIAFIKDPHVIKKILLRTSFETLGSVGAHPKVAHNIRFSLIPPLKREFLSIQVKDVLTLIQNLSNDFGQFLHNYRFHGKPLKPHGFNIFFRNSFAVSG